LEYRANVQNVVPMSQIGEDGERIAFSSVSLGRIWPNSFEYDIFPTHEKPFARHGVFAFEIPLYRMLSNQL
jgi:hypothetical protein